MKLNRRYPDQSRVIYKATAAAASADPMRIQKPTGDPIPAAELAPLSEAGEGELVEGAGTLDGVVGAADEGVGATGGAGGEAGGERGEGVGADLVAGVGADLGAGVGADLGAGVGAALGEGLGAGPGAWAEAVRRRRARERARIGTEIAIASSIERNIRVWERNRRGGSI